MKEYLFHISCDSTYKYKFLASLKDNLLYFVCDYFVAETFIKIHDPLQLNAVQLIRGRTQLPPK